MHCLSCGYCCRSISPLGNPCPKLKQIGNDIYICSEYSNRPEECVKHEFDQDICPIGLNTLEIKTLQQVRDRLDLVRTLKETNG
jgi:hypothetical protein